MYNNKTSFWWDDFCKKLQLFNCGLFLFDASAIDYDKLLTATAIADKTENITNNPLLTKIEFKSQHLKFVESLMRITKLEIPRFHSIIFGNDLENIENTNEHLHSEHLQVHDWRIPEVSLVLKTGWMDELLLNSTNENIDLIGSF